MGPKNSTKNKPNSKISWLFNLESNAWCIEPFNHKSACMCESVQGEKRTKVVLK